MFIHEAVEMAMASDGFITPSKGPWQNKVWILPTNGCSCCVIFHISGRSLPGIRWNPTAHDLMTNMWRVDTCKALPDSIKKQLIPFSREGI